jgi:D-sedoheptulose 7-phosphate isomerase
MSELNEHQSMITRLAICNPQIEAAAELLINTLRQGGKILLCGNGGSAADCQHIAAELVVRYKIEDRPGLAAIALTTDSSILTAHSNDCGFANVFARQVQAIGNNKDCLIAISTSGVSESIINAAKAALAKDMTVIALTGKTGGDLLAQSTLSIIVPSDVTARIQEAHILIGHWWCGEIEEALSVGSSS